MPIQKQIEKKLADYSRIHNFNFQTRYLTIDRDQGGSNTNKREGREYFDRNRERDREQDRGGRHNDRERDERRNRSRTRSKSRDRTLGHDRDRYSSYKERSDRDYSAKDRDRGGRNDRREKDYYRDGEGSSSNYDYSSSSRYRDRKYK